MILKSLELQGFKTFPDKTVLNFEDGITSVVGPNGSGKSNISDAIRWALGEQSVRALRCSRMEDVIFSGTPQRSALGFAQVTLTIDNSDRGIPFDADTLAVTRRYYRSGESEYLINKASVRLKDINELFMDTGLGRDGYSIIGQGRIDSIVAAKSEDRREIFEEAAGISRFRYRKEEAEKQLSKAQDNLVRLKDILSELESRVGPLKEQAERAEEFIALDSEKKELEIGLWLSDLERYSKSLREQEERIGIVNTRQGEIEEKLSKLSIETEDNTRSLGNLAARMESLREEASALEQDAVRSDGEGEVLRNNLEFTRRDSLRLEERLRSLSLSAGETEQEISSKKEALSKLDEEIGRRQDELLEFTESLEKLREQEGEAEKAIELAAIRAAEINSNLAEERVALSSASSAREELERNARSLEERMGRLDLRDGELAEEEKEAKELLSQTERAITSGENAVKGYELKAENRQKRVDAAREALDKITLDMNAELRRAKLLEDLERNLEGFTQSVKAVMREANRGMLKGICGPVSRIIETPGEYAVALETALGASMQNIVVETEEDGKNAIRFLKDRDLGRATFMPVSTVRGSVISQSEVKNLPGFIGIARDLCKCGEKYSGIRDSLLGRVIVVDTLDNAALAGRRLNYRYRVVSLDGQVLNVGGSMTGGSKARGSGLLSRASEIAKIKSRAEELKREQSEAESRLKILREQLAEAQGELSAYRGELSALNEDRVRANAELERISRERTSLIDERDALNREKLEGEKRYRDLKEREISGEELVRKLTEESETAQKESEALTGGRDESRQRAEEASRRAEELRMNVFSARKERDLLSENIESLRTAMDNAEGERVKINEEMERLKAGERELLHNIEEAAGRAAKLREDAESRRAESSAVSLERDALEQNSLRLRNEERELENERGNAASELARLTERGENLKKECDGILKELWEEYELTRKEAQEIAKPVDDLPKAQRRLAELKNRIRSLGAVNVGAVVEYKEVNDRYTFMKGQIDDAERSREELIRLIAELTGNMREQFTVRFGEINRHFGEVFRELFGGGSAELAFTEIGDVLTSGIDIRVRPPGKIVNHIEALSGGEKSLVAICIYFAIMQVNPPPFCVLDEIDAALDDVNVARYASYLRRMSEKTQFISITHRRGTMEGSDVLYGVTMQDEGVSKLLTLRIGEEKELLK